MHKYKFLFGFFFLLTIFLVFKAGAKTNRHVASEKKYSFTKTSSGTLRVGSAQNLSISVHNGNITLKGINSDILKYSIKKQASNISRDEAALYFSKLILEPNLEGETIKLHSEIGGELNEISQINTLIKDRSLYTHLTLQVPKTMKVKISTLSGNVILNGVNSEVNLSAMEGDVEVNKVKGATRIYAIQGDIDASNIEGPLRVENYEGKITVQNSTGSVSAQNSKGRIIIRNVKGDVKAKNVSGNILLSKIEGAIKSRSVKGRIKTEASSGSVDIKSIKGSILIQNLKLREDDRLSLVSVDGDLQAHLPDNISGDVKAQTRSGVIRHNFDVRDSNGHLIRWRSKRTSLVGKVNIQKKGKNNLFLKTVNGDITLRKINPR